jgi:hypothetical protein
VAITETDTLVDVAVGVVVVMDGTSVIEMIVDTLTLTLGTVEAVTVVVGVARDRHPQAVEISEQSNATGAPAHRPVAVDVVVVLVVVEAILVVLDVELDEPTEQD